MEITVEAGWRRFLNGELFSVSTDASKESRHGKLRTRDGDLDSALENRKIGYFASVSVFENWTDFPNLLV